MHRMIQIRSQSPLRASLWSCLISVLASFAVVCGASSPAWSKGAASLWIADEGDRRVIEIPPSTLKQSGTVSPIVNDGTAIHDDEPTGVCFDGSKNLWVTGFSSSVLKFTPAQLKNLTTTPEPVPVATIVSMSFGELDGCTFDKQGNLWVVDATAKGMHKISKSQLNAGGTILPALTITATADLDFPNFAVFDKSGNLWVTSEDSSTIVEFAANQLKSSGDKTPAVILSDDGSGSIDEPGQAAFDGSGNLWVPNYGNSTVVMFKKSDLGSSGSPTPKITLMDASVMSSDSLDGPWGLTFRGKGALWVSNYSSGNISMFIPSQIKSSGAPVPKVFLKGAAIDAYQLTFGPAF